MTSKLGTKDRASKVCPNDYLQSFGEKVFVSDDEIRLAEQYLIKVLHPGSKCKYFNDIRVIFKKAYCYLICHQLRVL